jgi:uncharacterized membrane protein YphA (DoxX/SURF4 family)
MKYLLLFLRLVVAFIFVQSLYFKFTGHAEAIHIFSTIGMEPWGRYLVGTSELLVAIMLFIPKTRLLASFGAIGLMIGAIGFHLFTPLGINVTWDGQSDGGMLFGMAVTALLLSAITIALTAPRDPKALISELTLGRV